MRAGLTFVAFLLVATVPGTSGAQQPPTDTKTGNPTPGTSQPDPPNPLDRITLTGCVRLVASEPAPATAPTVPAASRFTLAAATREARVPPDTGTSPAAAAPAVDSYRLEALESLLSPFVGTQVEISGEVKAASGQPPVLLVEFVQKIAPRCR